MRWSQLDLDAGLWTITTAGPYGTSRSDHERHGGEGTKNGLDKVTPLSRQAVALLRAHEATFGRVSDYVFPGRDLSSPMYEGTMLARLKTIAGDDTLTAHGLRGTFRTWAQEDTEFDRETVEHCMHHILGDAAERAYKHGKALAKRRAVLQAWADFATRPAAKVVALKSVA
jgi:integrase